MGFHIYDLCTAWKDWLISQQRDYALQFLNILKSEKFTVFSPSAVLTETQIVQLNDVSTHEVYVKLIKVLLAKWSTTMITSQSTMRL